MQTHLKLPVHHNKSQSKPSLYSIKPQQLSIPKDIQPMSIYSNLLKDYDLHISQTNRKIEFSTIVKRTRIQIIQKMRKIIHKFQLSMNTLYLSIYLMDLLITKRVNLSLDKIGFGALILSVKYTDIDGQIPSMERFREYNNTYSINDMINIEIICLKKLNYILSYPHPINFIHIFLVNGIIFNNDISKVNEVTSNVYNYPSIILDYVMEDSTTYFQFHPLLLAAACVALSREIIGVSRWNIAFENVFKIKDDAFDEVFEFVKRIYDAKNKGISLGNNNGCAASTININSNIKINRDNSPNTISNYHRIRYKKINDLPRESDKYNNKTLLINNKDDTSTPNINKNDINSVEKNTINSTKNYSKSRYEINSTQYTHKNSDIHHHISKHSYNLSKNKDAKNLNISLRSNTEASDVLITNNISTLNELSSSKTIIENKKQNEEPYYKSIKYKGTTQKSANFSGRVFTNKLNERLNDFKSKRLLADKSLVVNSNNVMNNKSFISKNVIHNYLNEKISVKTLANEIEKINQDQESSSCVNKIGSSAFRKYAVRINPIQFINMKKGKNKESNFKEKEENE